MRKLVISGAFAIALACVLSSSAQKIRIRVVQAHNGKPISDECLLVSLGSWHGADIYAPIDGLGATTLSLSQDQASATPASGRTCGSMNSSKSFYTYPDLSSISVLPWRYVSCQYSRAQTKNPIWLHDPTYQKAWIPSFKLSDILSSGVVAPNTCSKLKPVPIPGELTLIVRKVTLLEGLRQ